MAVNLLVQSLVPRFDSVEFIRLINHKFSGNFAPIQRPVRVDDEDPWAHAEQLGIVKHLPGPNDTNRPLIVVAAELPPGEVLRERSSRLKQFRFARMVLEDAVSNPSPDIEGLPSQGLFVFHDREGNSRLSLVYATPKGTTLEWSTFKRYSFYVEAGAGNKTFRDRAALPWTTFDQLSDAFSVEKLTKEFYRRLFDWYQRAMDSPEVVFPNDIVTDKEPGAVKSEQIIRLITRLMFVWFLKQKHLVPDQLFDADALRKILKDFNPADGYTYYRAILQNLFFATLNSEIPDRAFAADGGTVQTNAEHFDIKTLYRYGGDFAWPEEKVLQLFHEIPFLNGGLFECLDRGRNYYDGFSRRASKQARVPNVLFFGETDGLLPLLRQYNFTVEENSPGDEEVALDPELLGKVFENLLAAYNPETNVQARKATGSFYTPREIVNYMVDESLIAHLTTTCGEEHETAIRTLFTDGVPPEDPKLSDRIDTALTTVKVLDPACGSGAFPMGALLRMVDILRTVRHIPEDRSVYDLKLELIENAIYGADIQTIAVQISKLRFFISLIAEQQPTDDPVNNYGIHSLPNLETKFVAANSLIGLPHATDALPMQDVEDLKQHLWEVRHRHFQARSYREKKDLRKQDQALRTALAEALEDGGGFDTEAAHLMAAWDPYDQNTSATFLDPEWMFNIRDGFDVVIGNPPYIDSETMKKTMPDFREFLRNTMITTKGNWDIYIAFFEKGYAFTNKGGVLIYITPNKWLSAPYGKALRNLFNNRMSMLCDCSNIEVFEAGNSPVVSMVAKESCESTSVNLFAEGFRVDQIATIVGSYLSPDNYGVLLSPYLEFINKMTTGRQLLGSMFAVENPFATSEAYELQSIIQEESSGNESQYRFVNTGTIGKYYAKWGFKQTTYLKRKFDKPTIEKAALRQLMPKRDEQSIRPKIITKGIRYFDSFLDKYGDYVAGKSTLIVFDSNDDVSRLGFLVAILNSKAVFFFLKASYSALGIDGGINFSTDMVAAIPFPDVNPNVQHRLEQAATEIAQRKSIDHQSDVSALEAEIDQLVYKLYDLTPEEIAIVEESTAADSQTKQTGPQPPAAKKPTKKKSTPDLPPSLPGWD